MKKLCLGTLFYINKIQYLWKDIEIYVNITTFYFIDIFNVTNFITSSIIMSNEYIFFFPVYFLNSEKNL